MGRMKKIIVTAMIAALVVFVTACGRTDNGTVSSGSSQNPDPTVMQTTTESAGQSGGVLRDVIDDVENGMNDVMDDGSGTGNPANSGNIGNVGNGTGVNGVE